MKKLTSVFIFVLLAMVVLTPISAFGADASWRVMHDNVSLYTDETMQNKSLSLPRYAIVEVVSQTENTFCVVYMGVTGYVYRSNLYLTDEVIYTGESDMKITASALGQKVKLYKYPYYDAPVLSELSDGQSVTLKESRILYDEFSEVVVDGVSGFILTENLTSGLTMNEIIAITVAVVTVVLVALVLTLLLYSKRLKTIKLRRQEQLLKEENEYGEQP